MADEQRFAYVNCRRHPSASGQSLLTGRERVLRIWRRMSINHKDVILQLIRDYQSFHTLDVEHLNSPPTALEFSRIVARNRPVVFDSNTRALVHSFTVIDATSDWPAFPKWRDPDYFRGAMGSQRITVAETPDGYASKGRGNN